MSSVAWASKNRGVHIACDDGEVEHTGSGGGEGTTSVVGASIVIKGDRESSARWNQIMGTRPGFMYTQGGPSVCYEIYKIYVYTGRTSWIKILD